MTHYDLTAMSFHAGSTRSVLAFDGPGLAMAFDWSATPQGHDFWSARSDDGLDEPARAALREMLGQWEGEQRGAMGYALAPAEKGEEVRVQLGLPPLSVAVHHLATGGPVEAGKGFVVGERAGESLVPSGGAVAKADRTITLKIGRHVRVVSAPSDDWHPHDGGPCPVAPETMVEVRFRRAKMFDLAGTLLPVAARDLDWSRDEGVIPITHYRIVSPASETPVHQAMNAGAKQRERDIGDKLKGYEAEIARHHAMIERIAAEKALRPIREVGKHLKEIRETREAVRASKPETSTDIARSHGLAFGRGGKWGAM